MTEPSIYELQEPTVWADPPGNYSYSSLQSKPAIVSRGKPGRFRRLTETSEFYFAAFSGRKPVWAFVRGQDRDSHGRREIASIAQLRQKSSVPDGRPTAGLSGIMSMNSFHQ